MGFRYVLEEQVPDKGNPLAMIYPTDGSVLIRGAKIAQVGKAIARRS